MTTIVLIRHGESVSNTNHTFTGQVDSPLSETGKKQAELTAKYMDKYKVDVIYSSPFQRAFETALNIKNRQGCGDIHTDDAFKEINAGKWHLMTFDDIRDKYPDTYNTWITDIGNSHPDGGESAKQLYDRVTDKFKQVLKENEGKTVCITAHATPIRMIECFVAGKDHTYAQNVSWVPNASVTAYEYDGSGFTQIERGTNDYMGELRTVLPKNI